MTDTQRLIEQAKLDASVFEPVRLAMTLAYTALKIVQTCKDPAARFAFNVILSSIQRELEEGSSPTSAELRQ